MDSKVIETRVFKTCLKDGICISVVKPDSIILLEDAKENTQAVNQVSGQLICPILVDLRRIGTITKEARDHFSMKGRPPGVTAIAMLVKSPVSSLIGNFFLGLNKPVVPTQLFISETKALKWLQEHKKN